MKGGSTTRSLISGRNCLVAFESAEHTACQGRNANRYAQFYSAQQRFFLQLMMAYTLPDVIPAIETDLREGSLRRIEPL